MYDMTKQMILDRLQNVQQGTEKLEDIVRDLDTYIQARGAECYSQCLYFPCQYRCFNSDLGQLPRCYKPSHRTIITPEGGQSG